MQFEAPAEVLVATAYGLLGASLSALYGVSPRLRREPVVHVATALITAAALLLVLSGAPVAALVSGAPQVGANFFLFFTASLAYVPAVLFVALHYWEFFIERILSPASRRVPRMKPQSERAQWRAVHDRLARLAAEPGDVAAREALADLYARMGIIDSAVYEYRRAADWIERGYGHALVLFKAARLLVEKKKDLAAAVPILRRISRLYPKSYFAAYARRLVSHYEAHEAPWHLPAGDRRPAAGDGRPPGAGPDL